MIEGFSLEQVFTTDSPIRGNIDQIDAVILQFKKIETELQQFLDVHKHVRDELKNLKSLSIQKLGEYVEEKLVQGSLLIQNDLLVSIDGLHRYAQEIERIHRVAENTIKSAVEHLSEILDSAFQLEISAGCLGLPIDRVVPHSWMHRPSLTAPVDFSTNNILNEVGQFLVNDQKMRWALHSMRWHLSADRLEQSQVTWKILYEERLEAERNLIRAISQTVFGANLLKGIIPARAQITSQYTDSRVQPARYQQHQLMTEVVTGITFQLSANHKSEQTKIVDEDLGRMKFETLLQISNNSKFPFSIRHEATMKVLHFAKTQPLLAYYSLGLHQSKITFGDFKSQIKSVEKDVIHAQNLAKELPSKPGVQVFGMNNHDGALTVAISIGDIDQATHVAINVPGMNAEAAQLRGALNAANELFSSSHGEAITPAIVTWCGYNTPNYLEVVSSQRAESGAVELARVIDSVKEVRSSDRLTLLNLSVLAHSYGSTTAVESLKITRSHVDDLVIYGSAGIVDTSDVSEVNAKRIHVTDAHRDVVADLGRFISSRADPRDLPSVRIFSSDTTANAESVTVHDMYTQGTEERGYLSKGTSSHQYISDVISQRGK